ncbi:hypothetical protein RRF57_007178 [Xylaria bambusicola]|uniref:Mitochondrial division protein 1 n=1 Tax=Xylaria bambusicola TaxID=326684 RepID=A0AAN7UQ61_9PEZI
MGSLKARMKKALKPTGSEDKENTTLQAASRPISSSTGHHVAVELDSAERQPAVSDVEQQIPTYTVSQRLWNSALDSLKEDEYTADFVRKYFIVLAKALSLEGESPEAAGFNDGIIVPLKDPADRQKYMRKLVEEGQEKIATTLKIAESVSNAIGYIENIKGLISAAIADIPQAALPWAGVCIGLQILSNPGKATKLNLQGIVHVTSRMDWYCALSEHLLGSDGLAKSLEPVTQQLEAAVLTLYRALLLYQIKSACYYYQHRVQIIVRGLANWDDWDADLQQVKDAEATVETMSSQYHREYQKSILHQTLMNGIEREKRLGDVHQDLQGLVNQQREIWANTQNEKCLQDLFVIDPRHRMRIIDEKKGGLLTDACQWIFQTEEYSAFTNWAKGTSENPACRLLWINGPAGVGKTMLLISIIRKLESQLSSFTPRLSYFFCQGTAGRDLRSATSVLRNLIWLLLFQQPHLMEHIQPEHGDKGRALFENEEAFHALDDIFERMLKDTRLVPVYLIVDALDECDQGLVRLLRLISKSFDLSDKVRWLVSSRPEVLAQFDQDIRKELRNLERPHVARSLVQLHPEMLDKPLSSQIRQKAKNTFLWVALVFEELRTVPGFDAVETIKALPQGLPELYDDMILRIEKKEKPHRYKDILIAVTLAFRPLSFPELATVTGLPPIIDVIQSLVAQCGSFLTVTGNVVSLIHQSAKDYLCKNFQSRLQPKGAEEGHMNICQRSILAMSKCLRKNIYNIPNLDFDPRSALPPNPDPLGPIRYACLFWAEHLSFTSPNEYYYQVLSFLKVHVLHWLEAGSLMRDSNQCFHLIDRLEWLLQDRSEFSFLVQEAKRFMLQNRFILESAPLQLYSSAILFSPQTSMIQQLFHHEINEVKILSGSDSSWDSGIRKFLICQDVSFSPDGESLILRFDTPFIEIRNATTGRLERKLEGHSDNITSMALSSKTGLLATCSKDKTIRIWNITTGRTEHILKGFKSVVRMVAFSPCGNRLASCSGGAQLDLQVWDVISGQAKHISEYTEPIISVFFSPNGEKLVVECLRSTGIWDFSSGRNEHRFNNSWPLAVSKDGSMLASRSADPGHDIQVWELATSQVKHLLKGHKGVVRRLLFLPGNKLISTSEDESVRVWDIAIGRTERILDMDYRGDLVASPDGGRVASFFGNRYMDWGFLKLWNVKTWQLGYDFRTRVFSANFSPNGQKLTGRSLSHSKGESIYVWDIANGLVEFPAKFRSGPVEFAGEFHSELVDGLEFSPDGTTLASFSPDLAVQIWSVATGRLKNILRHSRRVSAVTFSSNGTMLASASLEAETIYIWDLTTGEIKLTFEDHGDLKRGVIWVWDLSTKEITHLIAGSKRKSLPDDKITELCDTATDQTEEYSTDDDKSADSVILEPKLVFSLDDGKLACIPDDPNDDSTWVWDSSTGGADAMRQVRKEAGNHSIYSVDDSCRWVTKNGIKQLYLPQANQPSHISSQVSRGRTLAVGSADGRVTILEFSQTIEATQS